MIPTTNKAVKDATPVAQPLANLVSTSTARSVAPSARERERTSTPDERP
jgi:hypothetical protein